MTLEVWQHIRQEVKELAECEPMLASFFHSTILNHQNLGSALSYLLANKLANPITVSYTHLPLADTVGIPRDIVVSAYNWGQYIMLFLAPTGLVLVTLQMLGIPFNKWLKFVMPIVGCQFVISSILLLAQVFMYAQ